MGTMGSDFLDGLGETLTKTAKGLGERAEQIYEIQKIRNRISGEERIVDKVMADIGNLIYKRFESGEPVDTEIGVLCEEIHQHMRKIREYRETAANLRGQKRCSSCGKAVDKEVAFCPYCGAKCTDGTEDAAAREEQEDADSVIQENWEDNFPEEDAKEEADCGSEGGEEIPESTEENDGMGTPPVE